MVAVAPQVADDPARATAAVPVPALNGPEDIGVFVVLLTVATPVFDESHGLFDAGVPLPVNVCVPPTQALKVPVIVGNAPTVIVIGLDVAGEPVRQGLAFDVMITLIASPLFNVVVVYVEPIAPEILLPFNCHWYVGVVPPFVGVAVNVTLVVAQIELPGFAAMLTLAGSNGFTVVVIAFEVAGELVRHGVAFDVITTRITSPFANVVVVYVELVAPAMLLPLSCHWYVGVVPPFVGVAVKVTLVVAQIGLTGFAEMLTLAGSSGFTVIVIGFDVAGEPVAQVAFDVIITVTTSPLFKALLEKVALFVPTLLLFTCHW